MMLALFVVLAVANGALAQSCCSAQDSREVSRMWSGVWNAEFTNRRIAVAQAVFEDLFAANPNVKGLFKNVNGDNTNSPQFRAHCVRVVNGLDTAINLLTDPATLREQLQHLSAQHATRQGVLSSYFDAIAESFGDVIPQVANCFNPDAWNACFGKIAKGISSGLP